jgi:hypothetical protein
LFYEKISGLDFPPSPEYPGSFGEANLLKKINRRERGERREKLECKDAKKNRLFKFCVACFDPARSGTVSACSAVKNLKKVSLDRFE